MTLRDEKAATSLAPVLSVRDLRITFGDAATAAVDSVGFDVLPGNVTAIVGESGSGKTLVARSILRLLPPGARINAGAIRFDGQDLLQLPERQLQRIRGARIGIVSQEPLTSLNPAMRIGAQMTEGARLHRSWSDSEIRDRSVAMLERVRIHQPERCLSRYPHEFSGGMRQRIMLATVMMLQPALLIADEPTTALDPIIQSHVLELMMELAAENNAAVLMITHDLALIARYATDVVVMRRGVVVENESMAQLLRAPRETYTRELLSSASLEHEQRDGSTTTPAPVSLLVHARNISVGYAVRPGWLVGRRPKRTVLQDLDLSVGRGEVVALVGESGSGKTTFGRLLLGLLDQDCGTLEFDGERIDGSLRSRDVRRRMQVIFQDPQSSLDPRMRIVDLVAEPLRNTDIGADERRRRALQMLEEVGIAAPFAARYPHQLSGGQRQRVGIARALVARPDFVVADEAVAALDVTIRAQILRLIDDLRARYGFAMLFITHDLSVVERLAQRVAVLHRGRIVELGPTQAVFEWPQHPYTRELLNASATLRAAPTGGWALASRSFRTDAPPGLRLVWPNPVNGGSAESSGALIDTGGGHFVRGWVTSGEVR